MSLIKKIVIFTRKQKDIFVKMMSKIDEGLGLVWLQFLKLFFVLKNNENKKKTENTFGFY